MNSESHWTSNEDTSKELKLNSEELCIPAESLNIVWGKDRRHWEWINISPEEKLKSFKEAAVLHQVNWLEVVGRYEKASSTHIASNFEVYYIIKFRADAFGWDSVPIKFKINVGGKEREKRVNLEPYTTNTDTWHEINGGEFEVPLNKVVSLSFCMIENESEWWKGGMILAGVKIKPKITGEKAEIK